MKIAFLILAHKHPGQLARLIGAFNNPDHYFFIHIDKKSSLQEFKDQLSSLSLGERLRFVRARTSVYWGDYTMVRAQIDCLGEILNHKVRFRYIVLLSGQHYPLRRAGDINNFFAKNDRTEFLEYVKLPNERWSNKGLNRIRRYYFGRSNWILRTLNHFNALYPRRRFPGSLEPFGGSTWWALTNQCATYVYNYLQDHKQFTAFCQHTSHPDETIFQTVVLNSKFASNVVNQNLCYIDWSRKGAHPKVLDITDEQKITNSNCLFARKFDVSVDAAILDRIDEALLA